MHLARTGVQPGPSPLRPAPSRTSTPLPGTFSLSRPPGLVSFDGGSVLMSGSPIRLLRLSPRAKELMEQWDGGAPVGPRRSAGLLARRLVSAGARTPLPAPSGSDAGAVTVVIPVRDRPEHLHHVLTSLEGMACVVVDDGSTDAARTKEIAGHHGAAFVGLPVNGGPSVARNAGLALVHTPLVAFVDSDCVPSPRWLEPLLGHFEDPLVAAVAPRIVPAQGGRTGALSRYEAVRSSLDRGPTGGLVRPQSRIPYVPSAALIVRRDVAGAHLFDPHLRGGEDVDLVWRLAGAGWVVRYEPASTVEHEGPHTGTAFLARRAFYGSTAAPLSERHPDHLSPLTTSAWTAAVWTLVLARRPLPALGALVVSIVVLARRLHGLVGRPVTVAAEIAGGGTAKAALPALAGLTRAWSPALVLGLLARRTRRGAALALLVPALREWIGDPGGLDPVRYTALHVADDLAYGSGVWAGCVRALTVRPLVPRIVIRSRVWSARSLQTQLADPPSKVP